MYGIIGRNGGDGPAPTEAMSPCTPDAVRDAADALGMARSHLGSPLSLKSVITAMLSAEGTFAVDGSRAQPIKKLDFHIDYVHPGARLMIDAGQAKPDIRVYADDLAWREESEGGPASPDVRHHRELEIMTKLTPWGAMWSLIEAEGHAKVRVEKGKTVIRGTSPYDKIPVSVVLDDNKRVQNVTVVDGRTTYVATFSDYREDMEPNYYFRFPKKLVWTKNGRPFADLTVTFYRTNPYVVFPVPEGVRRSN